MGILPSTASPIRARSGQRVRIGIPSTTRTTPSSAWNSVSRTRESPRSRRPVSRMRPWGWRSQRPWSEAPSSAAKQAPESNAGSRARC